MIDVSKLDYKTKMEMILIWLEYLVKKKYLSDRDKAVISVVTQYLYKEALEWKRY